MFVDSLLLFDKANREARKTLIHMQDGLASRSILRSHQFALAKNSGQERCDELISLMGVQIMDKNDKYLSSHLLLKQSKRNHSSF